MLHMSRPQVKRCKTDTFDGLQFGDEARPECSNLMTIYQLATGQSKVSREWGRGGGRRGRGRQSRVRKEEGGDDDGVVRNKAPPGFLFPGLCGCCMQLSVVAGVP